MSATYRKCKGKDVTELTTLFDGRVISGKSQAQTPTAMTGPDLAKDQREKEVQGWLVAAWYPK